MSSDVMKSLSQESAYRKVYRDFTSSGGYCKLRKVSGDSSGILRNMYNDKEKHFLGSNCSNLLALFNDTSKECGQFQLSEETPLSGFKQVEFITFGNSNEEESKQEEVSSPALDFVSMKSPIISDPVVPPSLKNDKATEQVSFLMKPLKTNCDC